MTLHATCHGWEVDVYDDGAIVIVPPKERWRRELARDLVGLLHDALSAAAMPADQDTDDDPATSEVNP